MPPLCPESGTVVPPSIAPRGTRLGHEHRVGRVEHCNADDATVNDERHQENHRHTELGASRESCQSWKAGPPGHQRILEGTVLPEQGPNAPSP